MPFPAVIVSVRDGIGMNGARGEAIPIHLPVARGTTMERDSVCVIGAGPYGLTAAAYLRAAGLDVRVFGETMSFWKAMPTGMLLRSTREGITLHDPQLKVGLVDYERACGVELATPVARADYLAYVDWYQRQAVPAIDTRRVVRLDRFEERFRMQLDDGELVDTPGS